MTPFTFQRSTVLPPANRTARARPVPAWAKAGFGKKPDAGDSQPLFADRPSHRDFFGWMQTRLGARCIREHTAGRVSLVGCVFELGLISAKSSSTLPPSDAQWPAHISRACSPDPFNRFCFFARL